MRVIDFEEHKFGAAIDYRFVAKQNVEPDHAIVLGLRLPRAILAALVGLALAGRHFAHVFIAGLNDGRFPARSALGTSGLALGSRVEIECVALAND